MKTALLTLVLACAVFAEPRVREDEYDVFDLASMKAGDWVEMTDVSEHAKADGTKDITKRVERTACVKADDEFVWIEDAKSTADKPDEKEVTLAQVRRKDRKAVKAWSGKEGGEGTELKLAPSRGKRPAGEGPKSTGKVTAEKAKLGDKEVDAQKLEITMVRTQGGKEQTTLLTIWTSRAVPVKVRLDDAAVIEQMAGAVAWDKAPEGPTGVLKVEMKDEGWSMTQNVSGSGTDAKPTLIVK